MKIQRLFLLFGFLSILLAACGSPATPAVVKNATRVPENTKAVSQAGSTEDAYPEAVSKARVFLAKQLNISVDEITVTSFEAVEWPDSCLGVDVPGMMCAQMITPGYQVMLEADGKSYELHTNQSGESIQQKL